MPIPRIAVIGGGMAGLAAAWELAPLARRGAVDVELFEASKRLGGAVCTDRGNGGIIEGGPDSFLARKPEALTLVREVGLEGSIIGVQRGGSYLLLRGRFRSLPTVGPSGLPTDVRTFLRSDLLSWRAKLRASADLLLPRTRALREGGDVSLGKFLERRLGREVVDHLAAPVAGGIHLTDVDELSLRATYPELARMEAEHRSLILGVRARAREGPVGTRPPVSPFLTLRSGLASFVEALVEKIPEVRVRTHTRVEGIDRDLEGRYRLQVNGNEEERFDGVVLCTSAPDLASLLPPSMDVWKRLLGQVHYSPVIVVGLAYRGEPDRVPFDRAGVMIPREESRVLAGISFPSRKWGYAVPGGGTSIRAYLDGRSTPYWMGISDAEVLSRVGEEINRVLGIGKKPFYARVFRHPTALPQYRVGHLDLIRRIKAEATRWPGVALAGALYNGIGLSDCIRSGREGARAVLASLGQRPGATA